MAHFHLQLFASRFNDVAEGYLQRAKWICEGIVPELSRLMQAIDSTCSKQQFTSQRSLVFDDVESQRDILRFYDPIQCCGKTLLNSDSLMMHILQYHDAGQDEINNATQRLAIMFNLFVQLGSGILERYDNNYDMIEQFTVQHLRKAAEYLSCIQQKPIRCDGFAADTFVEDVTFAKWKYVFDYTCGTCADTGIDNCRYVGAIAWFKIHLNTMGYNPIRHLGTKMHAANLRECLPDRVVGATPRPRLVTREVQNHGQLSRAAKYLLEVRESELDKLCVNGSAVQRNTLYEAVKAYLKAQLEPVLKKFTIEPFGSRVTGVGNYESDLDLVIQSEIGMKPKTAYYKVLTWAKENRNEVEIEKGIPAGPLVLRLKVGSLNLTLDLTFDSPYVVGNSAIIAYFFRLQPLARKLFFLLKEWKQLSDIGSKFHHNVLSSLIVFYCQTEQFLPPVAPLINGPEKINGLYNTNFVQRIAHYAEPYDLLTLLKHFFAYWAQFDWTRNGVSVKEAQILDKAAFHNNGRRTTVPPMVVTDYFDVTRNVAGNIQPGDCQKFVQACREAVDVLKSKRTI